jgi:hypothetical protein
MNTKIFEKIVEKVRQERLAQDKKWGKQDHPTGTGETCISRSIFGLSADFARELCDGAAEVGRLTWSHIILEEIAEALEESDPMDLEIEVIQCIAVLCGMLENMAEKGENNVP